MKASLLSMFFLWPAMMICQNMWRPIGVNDFAQASYGNTNISNDNVRSNRLIVKNGNVYLMNLEVGNADKHWLVLSKFSNGFWQHIETPFWITASISQATTFSFDVDNNEVPYLFINDELNDYKATVKKFDGTTWIDLGGVTVSGFSSDVLEMTIGNDNLPVVVYKEGAETKAKKFGGTAWTVIPASDLEGLYSAVVKTDQNNVPYVLYGGFLKKFNGAGWDEVGISGFPGTGTAMCLDSQNQPYIVTGSVIRKFNGTSWQIIPSPPSLFNSVTLDVDAQDNLYAAYTNTSLIGKTVSKFTNGAWQSLGSASSFGPISISIDGDMVYEQHTKSTNYPVVRKRIGSDWTMLGDDSQMLDEYTFSAVETHKYNDLTVSNGLPVIAYKNLSGELSVKECNAFGIWSTVGSEPVSEQNISNAKIETDSEGNTYVAYLNLISDVSTETNSLLTVKKRVGNSWELVGPLNFSLSAETKMDFKINHQNVPYVVYKSGRVQRYNGSSWEFVGGTAYANDKDVALTFDNNDQPYLIYVGSSGPIVKTFNGTSWQEVGTESIGSFTNAKHPRMVCDAGNNIIIAFLDANKKIQVRTWNGTAWVSLGIEIDTQITAFGVNFLSLAIDSSNVPHIFFNRMYNGFRKMANLYKYNGAEWEPVGETDFSPADVTEGNVSFTATNIPVVSYNSLNGIYSKYFGEEGSLLDVDQFQIAHSTPIIISPNPTAAIFSVKADAKIDGIAIFDLTGKKVFSGGEQERFDISSLQQGLYMIKVSTDKGSYSGRIIKQ